MNETTLKLASIKIGDSVTYLGDKKQVATGTVVGWCDRRQHGQQIKHAMLEDGTLLSLEFVLSRQRESGCGSGVITFEPLAIV